MYLLQASIVGKHFGRHRWPGTSKTAEGTVAYVLSVLLGSVAIAWVATKGGFAEKTLETGGWARYAAAVFVTGGYLLLFFLCRFLLELWKGKVGLVVCLCGTRGYHQPSTNSQLTYSSYLAALTGVLEAVSLQNDNVMIPLFAYAAMCLSV